jgi:hypothetical protein
LEPVRQSGSGPAGPDKNGRNRIFAGFFCRIFAGLTSKMIRSDFLQNFCQIGVKNDPAGFRPDKF